MDNILKSFIFATFKESFDFVRPYLENYESFSNFLIKEVQVKTGGNIQYNFDVKIDEIFIRQLKKHQISGKIFSEESGWIEQGDKKYRVVYDPFCNSTLASRAFLDAAAGISIFSYDYQFITSAILDFQTGILGIVEDGSTNFYQLQSGTKLQDNSSLVLAIEDAWVAISLEKSVDRQRINELQMLFDQSKRLLVGSGHLYWLRLAIGTIDAYLDPFGGEKLYEMFAATIAQHNGCIVTNVDGEMFDPVKYLRLFETDQEVRFYPVSARNEILHKQVMTMIHIQ